MQGPSEFSMTEDAVIADMDLSPELRRMALPVLLTNGAFDTMRGPNIRQMAAELADVSTVVFPKSGHMTMVDEPLEMAEVLEYWWQGIEESSIEVKLSHLSKVKELKRKALSSEIAS